MNCSHSYQITKMMTLQEAKDQIAKKYGYKDWESVNWYEFDERNETTRDPYGYERCFTEAAELYAQHKLDEAALNQMILNDKRIADIELYELKPLQEKYYALTTYVNERKIVIDHPQGDDATPYTVYPSNK